MGQVIVFMQANWKEISMLSYVVIDALIYFIPSLKANGLLQQVEFWLKGQSVPPAA